MQKIEIKNFFALKQVEIELDKILLLIGEQASGKSTIAKLVYFFHSLPHDLLAVAYENLNSPQECYPKTIRAIQTKFHQFFGSVIHLPLFEIFYTYSSGIQIKLGRGPEKPFVLFPTPLRKLIFEEQLPNLLKTAQALSERKNAYDEIQFAAAIKEIERFVMQLFESERSPLYVVAGRNIAVGYSDQLKMAFFGNLSSDLRTLDLTSTKKNGVTSQSADLYLMADFLIATEKIKEKFLNNTFDNLITLRPELKKPVNQELLQIVRDKINKILKGEYRQDWRGERIYFSDTAYVDLNDASSGQQETIRILQDIFLIILDNSNAFRVIEEPEAHLYPLAQKHLIELMALMLNHTDSHLIVTTHSPYILSIFNNLLYASRVATLNPAAQPEIAATIPQEFWLQAKSFHAYGLKDGTAQSIVDGETGLIDQNFLDEISVELGDEFDMLYHIHAKAAR